MKKKVVLIICIILTINIVSGCYQLNKRLGYFKAGNSSKYNLNKVKTLDESPINGKKIIFLGSSVTKGFAAKNISFVDYIQKRDSIQAIKEAVSGTTLVDNDEKSYVSRLVNNLATVTDVDAFVCQLSTNDATKNLPLGNISDSKTLKDFDTSTITGAMEYIICYAQEKWECPVIFYTGTCYESEPYGKMVDRLLELQKKWDIGVIDMWNDDKLNNIDQSLRKLYMNDDIHPMKAGYLEWWTPKIEENLYRYLR